jgi:hypothetical protein
VSFVIDLTAQVGIAEQAADFSFVFLAVVIF